MSRRLTRHRRRSRRQPGKASEPSPPYWNDFPLGTSVSSIRRHHRPRCPAGTNLNNIATPWDTLPAMAIPTNAPAPASDNHAVLIASPGMTRYGLRHLRAVHRQRHATAPSPDLTIGEHVTYRLCTATFQEVSLPRPRVSRISSVGTAMSYVSSQVHFASARISRGPACPRSAPAGTRATPTPDSVQRPRRRGRSATSPTPRTGSKTTTIGSRSRSSRWWSTRTPRSRRSR